MQIIPAINASDFAAAKKQAAIIKSFLPRGSWVHLDVGDGVFGSVKSWGEAVEFPGLKLGFYKTEVHLMVESPEDLVEMWLKEIASSAPARGRTRNDGAADDEIASPHGARNDDGPAPRDDGAPSVVIASRSEAISPSTGIASSSTTAVGTPRDDGGIRIIAHLEAIRNSSHVLDLCQKYGAELMIAVNPETMVENLIPYFHNIKYFQILAVTPGKSGQKFQDTVWEKVRFLRERAPDVIIEIDGGVNPDVAAEAKAAGADMVVSGSYIMNAEKPEEAYRELVATVRGKFKHLKV